MGVERWGHGGGASAEEEEGAVRRGCRGGGGGAEGDLSISDRESIAAPAV